MTDSFARTYHFVKMCTAATRETNCTQGFTISGGAMAEKGIARRDFTSLRHMCAFAISLLAVTLLCMCYFVVDMCF